MPAANDSRRQIVDVSLTRCAPRGVTPPLTLVDQSLMHIYNLDNDRYKERLI